MRRILSLIRHPEWHPEGILSGILSLKRHPEWHPEGLLSGIRHPEWYAGGILSRRSLSSCVYRPHTCSAWPLPSSSSVAFPIAAKMGKRPQAAAQPKTKTAAGVKRKAPDDDEEVQNSDSSSATLIMAPAASPLPVKGSGESGLQGAGLTAEDSLQGAGFTAKYSVSQSSSMLGRILRVV